MVAAAQLLAWSLVLVLALLPASPLPQPFSSERHTRPRAVGASLGPGWVQELAGWPPLGSPSEEALWTRQALPALSPLLLAAPGGSLVFSGAGEPDDELWQGSSHAPLQPGAPAAHSAAISHDTGIPPAPAGSSALPPPAWPLLLGADGSRQTLEVPPAPGPAGTEGAGGPGPDTATFQGHTGLGSGSWPFTPAPGSGALSTAGSPGALAFESRELPSGSEPRSLQPASPSPARPPGAESSPGPAGQDSPGTAGTPRPRPTVSTVALAARPGSVAGASSAEWRQAADVGQEGRPVSWAPGKGQPAPRADVPWEPGEPLEHAWGKGRASYTQQSSLPPWGDAPGLPPHPTGRDGQPQPEVGWVPGASLAAWPAATSQPQQTAGAGGSVAGGWPGLPPAVLSAGRLELPPSLAPVQGRLTEPAPPAQGSPTWRLTPAWTEGVTLETRAPVWTEGVTLETRAPVWTEGLSAHQRSTRRALPGSVTQPLHLPGKAAPGTEQGPAHPRARPDLHASPGTSPAPTPPRPGAAAEEEIGAPQRVRGAVDPRTPVNTTSTATSAPRPPPLGTRHSDGTQPPGPGSTTAPVPTHPQPPATPQRGLIRVSTQRALLRPPLPRPGPSVPATVPASSLPCPHASGACSLLQPNQTLLRWADLQRTLGFAWELHVYGTSTLFLLLSLVCVASLVGSPVLGLPHLPYALGANALLLGAGLLRATFLLTDPYGARARLPTPAVRLLYNAPFPLLLGAFALLQLLPPPLQSLPLLAALASLQSTALLAADLLSSLLSPVLGVGLHLLSCACGTALMLASLAAYWQLRPHQPAGPGEAQQGSLGCEDPQELPGPGRALQGLGPCPRVLLGCSALGLLCCGLQAYGALWLGGVLGPPGEFSWPWWFVQFWFRICELLLAFALCFVASHPLCQCCGSADHTCWAKLVRYFCTYRKAEAPEYPNNCYDWANGTQERAASNDISKSLIRNPPVQVHLRALKGSNEVRATGAFSAGGSTSSLGRAGASPKCPNAARMGRSYTSVCFEKESVLSLGELEFRPPSPINLSRSIDEALFKEHLVRDSIFLCSSLQYPGRLARQDSRSSLRRSSALTPTAEPLLPAKAWQRRSSDPDYLYSLARCSSLSDLPSQSASLPPSKGLPSQPPTEGTISGSSLDSFSKGSLKISWNPWRHGLSSLESLPLEETPSRAPLLPDEASGPSTTGGAGDSEREARRSFLALSKQVDSRSLSSDTIEL
ncbi:proline-rich transmembrane protein 3 [Malaclemys terrapin pileata]|uniref:proline-rich transmembrane protein 3 n=1 Tax=Malaclemys terrapin pileata TaxID=2991368 RepID=UPI0023A8F5F3|nr:proline-rich transmembrane protein 3 [Malaclemys terrapin pileata]XP_053891955.1 proline-rich transmembrane protein 3 [Malaclemys terrapin pileata]XP_053891956.1 proline-rich transmembrane protein 3 [Malaclemys terrapin pileata]